MKVKKLLNNIIDFCKDYYRKSKENKKLLITDIAVVILIIVVIFVGIFIKHEINKVTLKNESLYTYNGYEKFDYKGKLSINTDKNITKIKLNNKEVYLDSNPLYYEKKSKVIFPKTMAIVFPIENGKTKKLSYYLTVTLDHGDVYLTNNNVKNKKVINSFLYDGNDLYFFFEKTEINYGNESITVSPLSFVIYNKNKELYIYNYKDKELTFEENVNNVMAKTDNYQINLKEDLLVLKKKNRVLMKEFKYLKNLTEND